MILREMGAFLAFIVVLGITSHVLGEANPRDVVRFDKFPYAPNKWENGGYFYKKLRIEAWKRALSDKSWIVNSKSDRFYKVRDLLNSAGDKYPSVPCKRMLLNQ